MIDQRSHGSIIARLAAEIFLATPLHRDDQHELARLNGLLWSGMVKSIDGIQVAEATAPMQVRCLLRDGSGEPKYTPCTLSGRSVVHPDSRAVFSAFSLTPHGDEDLTQSWPIHDLADALLHPYDEHVGYELLHELGLELEPEDAANLLT